MDVVNANLVIFLRCIFCWKEVNSERGSWGDFSKGACVVFCDKLRVRYCGVMPVAVEGIGLTRLFNQGRFPRGLLRGPENGRERARKCAFFFAVDDWTLEFIF